MSATASDIQESGRRPPRTGRSIVLGIDTLDLVLVRQWAAEGRLPFLKSLLDGAPMVRLRVLSRVLQGALWPSLLTGMAPGGHGQYYSPALKPGSYDLDTVFSSRLSAQTYYERLGDAGVRCALIDIPTDRPTKDPRHLQVLEWNTEFAYWRFETQPAALRDEIERRFGPSILPVQRSGTTPAQHAQLARQLVDLVDRKADLIADVLARREHAHVFSVFGEPHKAGHFLWRYHDPTHPEHGTPEPSLRHGLRSVYERIDAALARLAGMLDPEDDLIVFSDMGIQANYRGDHLVDTFLGRLGLRDAQQDNRLERGLRPPSPRERLRATVGRALRDHAPSFVRDALRRRYGAAARVDWSAIRMFVLPTDRNTYLRVNLRGREPQGTVAPGDEYEALLARVEQELRALVNVDTGRPAVEAVFRVHALFPGDRAHDLPDLAVLWSAEAPIQAVDSPTLGRIEAPNPEERSGNHREEGFLFVRGPSFVGGAREIEGDVLQLSPTLLALHGLQKPAHYSGTVLGEILAASQTVPAARTG